MFHSDSFFHQVLQLTGNVSKGGRHVCKHKQTATLAYISIIVKGIHRPSAHKQHAHEHILTQLRAYARARARTHTHTHTHSLSLSLSHTHTHTHTHTHNALGTDAAATVPAGDPKTYFCVASVLYYIMLKKRSFINTSQSHHCPEDFCPDLLEICTGFWRKS